MTKTAPEGSVSRAVLQLDAGPEGWQARLATTMPQGRAIAMTRRGILFAAFMVSLASRAPGRVNGWAGNKFGRCALLERVLQNTRLADLAPTIELSLPGITAETYQPILFNGNQS